MSEATVHPLLERGRIVIMPGVYDALSAKLAEQAGFPAVVLSGYGVAASYLGEPDVGLLTQSEILDVARRVIEATEVGVVVDGDTGHGGPLNVQRLVRELVAIGALGVILEDQRWPKRCGHLRGKDVIDAGEHAAKLEAAAEARGRHELLLTARTDALETHGVDEAIRRGRRYKEAGADVLFVEGPRTTEELARIGAELPGPLAVNLIEGGVTPLCPVEELAELGFFSIGFVLSGLFAATHALQQTYAEIRAAGSTHGLRDAMASFDEFAEVIGVDARLDEDARYRAGLSGDAGSD